MTRLDALENLIRKNDFKNLAKLNKIFLIRSNFWLELREVFKLVRLRSAWNHAYLNPHKLKFLRWFDSYK